MMRYSLLDSTSSALAPRRCSSSLNSSSEMAPEPSLSTARNAVESITSLPGHRAPFASCSTSSVANRALLSLLCSLKSASHVAWAPPFWITFTPMSTGIISPLLMSPLALSSMRSNRGKYRLGAIRVEKYLTMHSMRSCHVTTLTTTISGGRPSTWYAVSSTTSSWKIFVASLLRICMQFQSRHLSLRKIMSRSSMDAWPYSE
mmetsp:Transcript_21680/g.73710  ORF Transcript_21680/g.73710 Transcript_21680/m.73710 type:complete len:203 (-) Transcript_21680:505-1113(-)